MRLSRWTGPILFALGAAALAYGLANGQGTLNLFLVFPVITATGPWTALGIVLIVVGFFATFFLGFGSMEAPADAAMPPPASQPPSAPAPIRRWGGVVFLGPVPIVFGSDAKVTRWMLVAGLVLFVALLITVLFVWGL